MVLSPVIVHYSVGVTDAHNTPERILYEKRRMSDPLSRSGPSRRNLMRLAAVGGAAAGLSAVTLSTAIAETSSQFPADFAYPEPAGPSLALWGSSSFDDARVTEGVPVGFDARIDRLLNSYLGVPILKFGRGGETSTNIATRRGVEELTTYLQFSDDILPAEGTDTVKLLSKNIEWNHNTYVPGFVQGIPCVLDAADQESGFYTFTRTVTGQNRYAPAETGASDFVSYQSVLSKSSHHVIQVGRNNLQEQDLIRKNTEQCFAMSPQKTLVLGHFRYKSDGPDSERTKNVLAYNAWAKTTYGDNFIDPEEWIVENTKQTWLRYGDLMGSGVWDKKDDQADGEEGKIPRSLYASDGVHFNGWGYLALARLIEAKVNELGWFA